MLHAREDYQERIQDSADLIPEDEPVFLIRAQDVCAPATLQAWIDLANSHGASENIIRAAIGHREQMIAWQQEHGMRVPDMP